MSNTKKVMPIEDVKIGDVIPTTEGGKVVDRLDGGGLKIRLTFESGKSYDYLKGTYVVVRPG